MIPMLIALVILLSIVLMLAVKNYSEKADERWWKARLHVHQFEPLAPIEVGLSAINQPSVFLCPVCLARINKRLRNGQSVWIDGEPA